MEGILSCSFECQKNQDCFGFQHNGKDCKLGGFQVMDNENENEIWFLESWEPGSKFWFWDEDGSNTIKRYNFFIQNL